MKLQTLLGALLLSGTALATVDTIYNSDGSVASVFFSGESGLAKRDCTSNNCLRAYKARALAATSFCNTFTASTATAVAPFTQCSHARQASSACSCFVPKPTTPPPPACGPPGTHCTINTFIQDCCHAADGSVGCYFPDGDVENGVCFV